MFKKDSPRNPGAHLEPGDIPGIDPVEQRHQPDGFDGQQKVGAVELVTRTLLGIQLYVEQYDRTGIENRLPILYWQVLEASVVS